MWLSNPRTSHAKSNNVAMVTFCYEKNGSSINRCRTDENLNALIVILSVSNAQDT